MRLPTLVAVMLGATTLAFAADAQPVPYPHGYPQWTHVKTMVINPGHAPYDAFGGRGFEDFKGDSHTERAVGCNAASACFQCHTAQKDKDFVSSSLRL